MTSSRVTQGERLRENEGRTFKPMPILRNPWWLERLLRSVKAPAAALIVSTAGGNALRLLSTLLLTRILTPEIFGQSAIIASFFFTVAMLSELGIQAYVVRHEKGDEARFLDCLWTIHVIRGLCMSAAAAGSSYPLAMALGRPEMTEILLIASLALVPDAFVSIRTLTAIRHRRIARLCAFELTIHLLSIIINVALAILTRSIWGIVTAMIAVSAIRAVASFMVFGTHMHRFVLDRYVVADLWRFSRAIAASSVVTLILSQTDKIVLARALPLPEFGVYGIASTLAAAPLGLAHGYADRILYPEYSRAQLCDPSVRNLKGLYYERSMVFWGYIAACGLVIGAAPLIIRLVYDPRYYGASTYLSILSVASAMAMVTLSASSLFVAIGRSRTVLVMNFSRLAWLSVSGLLGYSLLGPVGIVLAVGSIELPAYLITMYNLTRLDMLRWRKELGTWVFFAISIILGYIISVSALSLYPEL